MQATPKRNPSFALYTETYHMHASDIIFKPFKFKAISIQIAL